MADNLQARGLSVDAPRQQGGGQATAVQTGPAKAISALLNAPTRDRDADHEMNPRLFLPAILTCLSNTPITTTSEGKADLPTTDRRLDIKARGKTRRFLCGNSLSSQSALTKHCDSKHPGAYKFQPVPPCKRHSLSEAIIDGYQTWSARARRVHGRIHSPN